MSYENDCYLKNNCKQAHCNAPEGCITKLRFDSLFDQANVGLIHRANQELRVDDDGGDLEAFKKLKQIQNNILDFVNSGKQLYIHSQQVGVGKTSWEFRLIQAYFKKIYMTAQLGTCRALFISVPKFLLGLKENITSKSDYIQHIKDNVFTCDLVIWDDIGTKSASVYEAENLLSIIDNRIASGKANIYSSNLNDEEVHNFLGDRLASRICNLGYNIELVGKDKRQNE